MAKRAAFNKQLVSHRTVAKVCDIDTETLRDWVASGDFPQPHSVIRATWMYDKAIIDHWLETGAWPKEAKFRNRREVR
jgi:hypothetical protein